MRGEGRCRRPDVSGGDSDKKSGVTRRENRREHTPRRLGTLKRIYTWNHSAGTMARSINYDMGGWCAWWRGAEAKK